jgi:hypothetical protein
MPGQTPVVLVVDADTERADRLAAAHETPVAVDGRTAIDAVDALVARRAHARRVDNLPDLAVERTVTGDALPTRLDRTLDDLVAPTSYRAAVEPGSTEN